MHPEELIQAGRLDEARTALEERIRKDPANPKLRISFFQLLSVVGDWERAMTQLNVAGEMDSANLLMVHLYRPALQMEALRSEVFAGKRSPLIFSEPSDWMALLVQANQFAGNEQWDAAAELRDRAFDLAESVEGVIDGEPFAWIADADMRLGPMLEAMIDGKYYWVPFSVIRRLTLEEPTDLRDMVWTAAHFVWKNQGESVGLIPTRYPGSHGNPDPGACLARKTEWIERPKGYYLGIGQRMLATDQKEYSLLDMRRIDLLSTGEETGGEPK